EYGFLVDEVTINETFFYRHEPQLQGFITEVLNPLVSARRTQGKKMFRIWSAAASTGDELYTIALILKDQGLLGKDMQFELVGTDISHEALKKARDGVYKKYNIRNVPPPVLQQCFTVNTVDDTYTLKSEIKSLCKFQEMNLMDATRCASLGKFDVIFVRNVLIYFDEKSKEQVVKNLCTNLHDDGYVIMGHSENVYSQRHLLKPDKVKTASLAHIKAPPGTEKL
ncbi:MAG: CheR family methyltransferase, partial [Alphaproteobacteria bacterium]